MKPYYRSKGITIYNGDCREILSKLPKVDLVLADPPYGINAVVRGRAFGTSNVCAINEYAPIIGDDRPFDPAHLLSFESLILWGANHYADRLPSNSRWLVWDKRRGVNSNPLADCELAWTNLKGPARLFSHRWMGMIRDSERERRVHPTQKPVALMEWCLSLVPDARLILDPYMGCGPSLVAARNLKRKAIGIELEEKYCEIAARRLEGIPLKKAA